MKKRKKIITELSQCNGSNLVTAFNEAKSMKPDKLQKSSHYQMFVGKINVQEVDNLFPLDSSLENNVKFRKSLKGSRYI